MTRERTLVEHRSHVDTAAANVRIHGARVRAQQVGSRKARKRRRAISGYAEFVEERPRAACRMHWTRGCQLLAAHGGRTMEQAGRCRNSHQCRNLRATA